ncbi:hypothetical protein I3843_11G010300 [Carya illinoinensis]|uniref:Transcription factor GTE10-like n=1 Tax=Carya illinoinensis TaxID=32201 RepID=A0A922IYM4_CARIL|nr:hypothetical protein I3760_11G010400 [Carya illinoinensis]KAG6686304.1 hypothetical protein I3842_11G010500 [Carya illinoinensis]KAG7954309.1 hypothetical protein I3843_11G010300 [Carya illinoinensis]
MAPTVPIEFTGQKESRKFSLPPMMGKSRKYSKGHSSGFVPDFRHAVETIGESEGFGSSGRVDTEMTVSEDSYAPKRKCISLNADSCDSFVVPMQVLSLSKMSRLERKDLESRLKMELEQVRTLQGKIFSLSSNAVVLSPSSDIRSCSDGKKRPPLESFQRSSEVLAPHGKKRPPAMGRNGSRPKKSKSGHFEPVKLAAPANTSNALLMEKCKTLLDLTRSHQYGWVFNEPVDVVKLKIPDYFTVIKYPMDLGTVKSKIASGGYLSPLEFAADVRLTFSNAMTYNPPGNDVHIMAKTLSKFFEARWKAIEKKLSLTTDEQSVPRAADHVESEINTQIPPTKRKKTVTQNDASAQPEPVRQIMTGDERLKLSAELEALLVELPESIVDFLKEHSAGQTDEEEIEIDIEALSDDTLFTLRKLLDDYMLERQKNLEKAEPCEIELHNESGFSNSSLQPCNDHADEDVDVVGGNDPPVSSHSPVEIEKDIANRNSKCSSSSSSSGESGSSSSDSDSGSSSRSETDAAKGSVPVDVKENLGSGATSDPKKNDLGDSEIENCEFLDSVNGVGLVEQNTQCKPMSAEVDGHQEGESAPSERQVSPEKLYRAALLRSRFADTILKAREKALEKDEKRDPEKLRLEREELERRQKEEKARLQAEAKAAEEFRRKAEAEAAAEAKRQRELDREAARQALLKMEKTVDINENGQFMEDLEMLRAAPDEHLQSFTEETSPDHSENVFGSFKLQGSNPLEQLGLYMKDDDDDEEEVEPPKSAPEPANDVEEGEID